MVYLVESDDLEGQVYRVDLEANAFRGACDCAHYRFRVQALIRETGKYHECKHIREALLAFGRDMRRQIREEARSRWGTSSRDVGA